MLRLALPAVAFLLAACSDSPATRTIAPGDASFAKGTTTSNRSATFVMPGPNTALSLRGDGLFPDGSGSDYTNNVCGVDATIFAPNPRQDAVLDTGNPTALNKTCAPYGKAAWPRSLTVDYGNGTETLPGTFDVRDLGLVAGTSLRFFGVTLNGSTRCLKLQFGGAYGGDSLWVTQTSPTSWHVYSQAAPHNTATCSHKTGAVTVYSNLNVDFVITTP